jgi:hypothetical protein
MQNERIEQASNFIILSEELISLLHVRYAVVPMSSATSSFLANSGFTCAWQLTSNDIALTRNQDAPGKVSLLPTNQSFGLTQIVGNFQVT